VGDGQLNLRIEVLAMSWQASKSHTQAARLNGAEME